MCLAVPMKLISVTDIGTATADAGGPQQEVNVSLIEDPRPGDYVIVHAGFAIEKLDESEAIARLALFGVGPKTQTPG